MLLPLYHIADVVVLSTADAAAAVSNVADVLMLSTTDAAAALSDVAAVVVLSVTAATGSVAVSVAAPVSLQHAHAGSMMLDMQSWFDHSITMTCSKGICHTCQGTLTPQMDSPPSMAALSYQMQPFSEYTLERVGFRARSVAWSHIV